MGRAEEQMMQKVPVRIRADTQALASEMAFVDVAGLKFSPMQEEAVLEQAIPARTTATGAQLDGAL